MEKLEYFGEDKKKKIKIQLCVEEIKLILQQINDGIKPNYCKCSYTPLKQTVQAAINGEIGESYRTIKKGNKKMIKKLAEYIIN